MKMQVCQEYNPIQFLDFAKTSSNALNPMNVRVYWWDHVNDDWMIVKGDIVDIVKDFGKMYIVKFENTISVSPASISPVLEVYLANQIEFEEIKNSKKIIGDILNSYIEGEINGSDLVTELRNQLGDDYDES